MNLKGMKFLIDVGVGKRIEDANIADKIKILTDIIANYIDEINNSFCIYYRGKLRIRRQ